MIIPAIGSVLGVLIGGFLTLGALALGRRRERRWAEEDARLLLEGAEKDAAERAEELQLELEERHELAFEKLERETRKIVARAEEIEEALHEREIKFKDAVNLREQALNRQAQSFNGRQQKVSAFEKRIGAAREKATELRRRLIETAQQRSSVPADELRAQVHAKLERAARTQFTKAALEVETELTANTERDARKILHLVMNRFARPYCPERGIGNVTFTSPEHKEKTFGPDKQFASFIEKTCGVDIVFNETYGSATVMGFDPVRRELGRLVLEASAKQKHLDEKVIEALHDRCKKELFKKILVDGNRVANELGLANVHEAVRSMLGALRYRYSFAQNQHFHVAEVGWLCGLLNAEFGGSIQDGRRAGVLHDIGKAMDHSKEGGHAVIGAEFIEQHGESPAVVHAVRAHHHDEAPSSDLAFLTIAADAISGARPGARRSTMDSYTQKMADLEKISSSFRGVVATYILSAGRELRVMVDGHKIDDQKALTLSKDIAHKIEEELSYPGMIKVTVVRETQAVEFAR